MQASTPDYWQGKKKKHKEKAKSESTFTVGKQKERRPNGMMMNTITTLKILMLARALSLLKRVRNSPAAAQIFPGWTTAV